MKWVKTSWTVSTLNLTLPVHLRLVHAMFREYGAGIRTCLSAGAPGAPGAHHLQVLDHQKYALGPQVSQ